MRSRADMQECNAEIVATNYFGLFDRDGGGAMGAIFIAGSLAALVLGTIAAIAVAIRTSRGNDFPPPHES